MGDRYSVATFIRFGMNDFKMTWLFVISTDYNRAL